MKCVEDFALSYKFPSYTKFKFLPSVIILYPKKEKPEFK